MGGTFQHGKFCLRISGTGMVVFQVRAKEKKTLFEVQKSLEKLDIAKKEEEPAPEAGKSGKPEAAGAGDTL